MCMLKKAYSRAFGCCWWIIRSQLHLLGSWSFSFSVFCLYLLLKKIFHCNVFSDRKAYLLSSWSGETGTKWIKSNSTAMRESEHYCSTCPNDSAELHWRWRSWWLLHQSSTPEGSLLFSVLRNSITNNPAGKKNVACLVGQTVQCNTLSLFFSLLPFWPTTNIPRLHLHSESVIHADKTVRAHRPLKQDVTEPSRLWLCMQSKRKQL